MIVAEPIPSVLRSQKMTADLLGLYKKGLVNTLTQAYLQALINADYVLNDLPTLSRSSDKKPVLTLHRVGNLRPNCSLTFHDPFFLTGVDDVESMLRSEPADIDVPYVRTDKSGLPLYSVRYVGYIIDGCDACMPELCRYPRRE